MKYCQHCGKELADEAQICMGCGCPSVASRQQITPAPPKKKPSKKKILLITVSVVLLLALAVGGYLLYDHWRTQAVIDQLVGHTFRYEEAITYYSGTYNYNLERLTFLNDEEVNKYYYYYTSGTDPLTNDYDTTYTIDFSDGRTYVNIFVDSYEVIYDDYGNIEALVHVVTEDKFDLTK